ncbi:MAG: twin-arginine translocase TatA/TatE family subunit [Verrucomicrobiae bacterium]|nr:twin-arginine translocase TatA/TatE family subunit [Verrucomicrobiae bacterium]
MTLMFFAFAGIGMPELVIIFLVIILLFGANKIPELARGLGKAMKEFNKAKSDLQDEIHNLAHTEETRIPAKTADESVAKTQIIPFGILLPGGEVKSPHSDFTLKAEGKNTGDMLYDAHNGLAFKMPARTSV